MKCFNSVYENFPSVSHVCNWNIQSFSSFIFIWQLLWFKVTFQRMVIITLYMLKVSSFLQTSKHFTGSLFSFCRNTHWAQAVLMVTHGRQKRRSRMEDELSQLQGLWGIPKAFRLEVWPVKLNIWLIFQSNECWNYSTSFYPLKLDVWFSGVNP